MIRLGRLFAFAVALLAACCVRPVVAQPVVSHTTPGAVQPGKSVELILHGAKLTGPLAVWTSFDATVEIPAEQPIKDGKSFRCKLTLAADAQPGIGGVVVGGPSGLAKPVLLLIDDLASQTEGSNNQTPSSAGEIQLPIAVDGVTNGTQPDYFRFAATAGQRVACEVVARRCGSNLDAVMRLLDSTGKELLLVDDDHGLGADGRFAYRFERDGQYLVEIRDNQYRSGQRYRLRLGDFPLVTTSFPLGVRQGSTVSLGFIGPDADGLPQPQIFSAPTRRAAGLLTVGVRGKDSSAMALVASTAVPEFQESEPNQSAGEADDVSLPCAISGRFDPQNDVDQYVFAARKGQHLRFRSVTRQLGSPAFVLLRLFDPGGKRVAETNTGDDQSELAHTAAADGMFCLEVEDLLRMGAPDRTYRIQADNAPKLVLSLKADKNSRYRFIGGLQRGAVGLDLACPRYGYDGPIRLELEDPDCGWRLLNPDIPAKAVAYRAYVVADGRLKTGTIGDFRILAFAAGQPSSAGVPADTGGVLKAEFPQLAFVPDSLAGQLLVAVTADIAPFFRLNSPEPVQVDAAKGTAQFSLKLERLDKEFKGAVNVLAGALPEAATAEIKQDKDTYNVVIQGLPAGSDATIQIHSYGEFKGHGVVQTTNVQLKKSTPNNPKPEA